MEDLATLQKDLNRLTPWMETWLRLNIGKCKAISHLEYAVSVWNPHHQSLIEQEAQLSQRGHAMPRVVEYFG